MIKNKITINTLATFILFGAIFTGAAGARYLTFWLPHWQGDQSQYVILAMKLGAGMNFKRYNLSETNGEFLQPADPPGTVIASPYRAPGQRGEILDSYYRNAIAYYDMPFFYKAPLFPMTLAISHKLFAGSDKLYSVLQSNLGRKVLQIKPPLYFKVQFWAAVIPYACSLLILLTVFLWTRNWFGDRPALYAAFMLAANPVSILTSNRLWTEDLMTLLITLAMILYMAGFARKRIWICAGAGVLMGLAVLTNQKSALAAAGLGLYTIFALRVEGRRHVKDLLLDARWLAFTAALTLVTFKWFWTIYHFYGNPIWEPATGKISPSEWGWQRVLLLRPHGVIFYTIGTAAISWGFAAGYASLAAAVRSAASAWRGVLKLPTDRIILFCWCWILPFAAYFLRNRTGEYRYLFPVYPALAALSGWMLWKIEGWAAPIFKKSWYATVLVLVFLAGSAVYSAHALAPSLWLERNLIHAPWR